MAEHPLLKALREGDESRTLEEIRDQLGRALVASSTPANAIPGIARELRVTLVEIERGKPADGDKDPVQRQKDQLAQRRADRAAGAAGA